jgi:nitrite reductase/ring-hydroxylating ferredoxin subunit
VIVTVPISEVLTGKPLAVRVSEKLTLTICELDGAYHAFDERCPHRGAALTQGALVGELVVCPLHHFKFNLKTGRCVMPKHLQLRTFAVNRDGERLSIDIKDAAEPAAIGMGPPGMPDPAR